jgi:FkbH-like protein
MVDLSGGNQPISLKELHAALAQADWGACTPWRVSVLRNITVEPIQPYWRYHAGNLGLNADIRFGDFDNVMQESLGASDESGLADADCVLVFLKLDALSSQLSAEYASLGADELQAEIERITGFLASVVAGVRSQSNGLLLMHTFELPVNPTFGALDTSLGQGQQETIRGLNKSLQEICNATTDCFLVDTTAVMQRLGESVFYDRRYWHIGRAPYSGKALEAFAVEHMKFMRSRIGRQKKCLLLDCDNTLWGGIVGEDGIDGIALGSEYPGSVFRSVQQEIATLANRGVIIGLVSKNNEADVWEVFSNHPDMLLKREHIAGYRINWEDKASNIQSLIEELNIGADSVVFVDDSSFELNLVAGALPDVDVIQLPKNPLGFEGWLLGSGLFDTLSVSAEDRGRAQMYRAENQRKQTMASAVSLDEYYASLEMEIELSLLSDETIPRAAQLTQKTNQFNLTTKRYSDSDLSRFVETGEAFGIHVHLKDKFGDYGVIGVALTEMQDDVATIDTFLLSCRALGRRVEEMLLREVLLHAQARGAERVRACYIPTSKNAQTAAFYSKYGFQTCDNVSVDTFEYDLEQGVPSAAEIFNKIESDL